MLNAQTVSDLGQLQHKTTILHLELRELTSPKIHNARGARPVKKANGLQYTYRQNWAPVFHQKREPAQGSYVFPICGYILSRSSSSRPLISFGELSFEALVPLHSKLSASFEWLKSFLRRAPSAHYSFLTTRLEPEQHLDPTSHIQSTYSGLITSPAKARFLKPGKLTNFLYAPASILRFQLVVPSPSFSEGVCTS